MFRSAFRIYVKASLIASAIAAVYLVIAFAPVVL